MLCISHVFFLLLLYIFFIFYYLTNQIIYCILNTLYRAGKIGSVGKITYHDAENLRLNLESHGGKERLIPISCLLTSLRWPWLVCAPTQRPTHNDNKGYTVYRRRVDTKMLLWIWFCSLLTSGAARMVIEVRSWASRNVFNRLPALFLLFSAISVWGFFLFVLHLFASLIAAT